MQRTVENGAKRLIKQRIIFLAIISAMVVFSTFCKEEKSEDISTEQEAAEIDVETKEVEIVEQASTEEVSYRVLLNNEEKDLLCRTVYCEAGNQSIETQEMVALTILNRLESEKFPDTLHDVIYQKNQYEVTTWNGFENYGWTDQVEQAVENALMENNHPSEMYYFRSGYYHSFGVPYIQSGDLYFNTEGR